MCARHRAGSRAPRSEPQKAGNYRCLSLSITDSLNTSGGSAEPSHPPLQLGGELLLSNNPASPAPSSKATWNNLARLQAAAEWQQGRSYDPFSCSSQVAFVFVSSPVFAGNHPVVFEDRNVRFLRCGLLILLQCSGDLLHNQRQCRQKGIQSADLNWTVQNTVTSTLTWCSLQTTPWFWGGYGIISRGFVWSYCVTFYHTNS